MTKSKGLTILIIVYIIFIIGFFIPFTVKFFTKLIPFFFIITAFFLFYFEKKWSRNLIIALVLIFLLSLGVEIKCVSMGFFNEKYQNGSSLGFMVMNVPVLFGLVWLILFYSIFLFMELFRFSILFKAFMASCCICIMDIVIGPAAGRLEMWRWGTNSIPIENFMLRFCLTYITVVLLKLFGVKVNNKVAIPVMVMIFLFFALLDLRFALY